MTQETKTNTIEEFGTVLPPIGCV